MDIKIYQGSGEKHNLSTFKLAVDFYFKKLFTTLQIQKINKVRIYIKTMEKDYGECFDHKNPDGTYDITINIHKNEPFHDIIATLAHELIHVKQVILGFLKYKSSEWYWKGKSYGPTPYKGLSELQQSSKLPWEKEAYDKERTLAKSFFNWLYDNVY